MSGLASEHRGARLATAAVAALALLTTAAGAQDAPPAPSHAVAEANGVRLHHLVAGPEDGPPVLLLHGWPLTSHEWRLVIPALAEAGHRVVAPDLRGVGYSEKPQGGHDKATMAEDVHALMAGLGHERYAAVGHDIGMMVAYALAAQRPEAVERLVLMEAPLPGTSTWPEMSGIWHFGFHQAPGVAEMLVADQVADYLRLFFHSEYVANHGAFGPEEVAHYAGAYALPGALHGGFEWYRAFPEDEETFAEWLQTPLPMPVLAIGGGESLGDAVPETVREVGPDVQGTVLDGCGHFLPEECPEKLADVLVSFLGGDDTSR